MPRFLLTSRDDEKTERTGEAKGFKGYSEGTKRLKAFRGFRGLSARKGRDRHLTDAGERSMQEKSRQKLDADGLNPDHEVANFLIEHGTGAKAQRRDTMRVSP